jgi:hypothetical protein
MSAVAARDLKLLAPDVPTRKDAMLRRITAADP